MRWPPVRFDIQSRNMIYLFVQIIESSGDKSEVCIYFKLLSDEGIRRQI